MAMEGFLLVVLCSLLSLYMLLAVDVLSFALHRTGWARFASAFLLFYAQIIATEFLLGLFSALFSYTLVILNMLLSAGILYAVYRTSGRVIFTDYLLRTRQSVSKVAKELWRDWPSLIVLLLALGFLAWIVFLGIIFPSIDYDDNSYHLTFIGDLIQNHTFFDAPSSSLWVTGYPKGGEFIQAWSALILHNDMFTDLTQVPFLLLAVYALYEVAMSLGAGKKQARFAALLFAFLPIVLNQLKTTYVDVMLCSVFIAGLAMVVQKKLHRLDAVLIGIIFSLLIAIKSTGLFFVIALTPLLLWNFYRQYGKNFKQYLQPLALIIAPVSFGLYWYIKDLVLYGSPLYPFGIKLAGITIFPGKNFQASVDSALQLTSLPHGCVQRLWFVWTEQKDWFGCLYNYDTNYAGLGPIWFIILIPAIIVSVYFAVKQRNTLYLWVTASVAALFAVYPANFYSRYTMFVTAIGMFALGVVLTSISKLTESFVKIVTIVLVLSVIATNFVLCNYAPDTVSRQLRSVLAGSARGSVYANFPGPAYTFLEARIRPHEVVVYDSKPFFIYPLWTPDFSDRVIYISAATAGSWYEQLKTDRVRYIFTTLGSKENRWAMGRLRAIFKDQMYEIFQAY